MLTLTLTLTEADRVKPATTSAWNTTSQYVPSPSPPLPMHRPSPSPPLPLHRPSLFHPKFQWGYNCEVLFSGWPGSSRAMYALALLFVFSMPVMVEWLTKRTDAPVKPGADRTMTCVVKTGMYAVRSGFSYLVVLSLVTFNGGIFLAAIFGHTLGFLIFRGRAIQTLREASG